MCCRETKIERVLTTLLPNSIKQGRKRANHVATELNQTWPQQCHTEVSKNRDRGTQRKAAGDGAFGEPEPMDGVSNFRLSEFVGRLAWRAVNS
jgi:hypothetical protein